MNNKKEMLRKAAAFVSAVTFLAAANFGTISAVAEEAAEPTTAETTAEAEETYTIQLRIADTTIRQDRQTEVLNRFRNSDIANSLPLSDFNVKNDEDGVRLEGTYTCAPSQSEAFKESIYSDIAAYSEEYTIGEELYNVSFNTSWEKFSADEYFIVEDNSDLLAESGPKFRGLKEYNGAFYVKRNSRITANHVNLREGYYAQSAEQPTLAVRKLTVENGDAQHLPRIGYYGDDGQFRTMVEIKKKTFTVTFDTNEVWLNSTVGKPDINTQQITVPWLDMENEYLLVQSFAGSDVTGFTVKDDSGVGNGKKYTVEPGSNPGTPVSFKELIEPQLTQEGKAKFTNNAEYLVSITGIHKNNTAWRRFEGVSTEKIELSMDADECFNIPYIIQQNEKTWYLSRYSYEYDGGESVNKGSTFSELLEQKLYNGQNFLNVPYSIWNEENHAAYKLNRDSNGDLFQLVYSQAAPDNEAERDELISSIISSAEEQGLHAGRRNDNTVGIEYTDSYTFELPADYEGVSFTYTDEKGRSYSKQIEKIETESGDKYQLKIDIESEENEEGYRPQFYKFILMTEGGEACPFSPFVLYFDNSAPEVLVQDSEHNETSGWTQTNRYRFEIFPEDKADDIGELPDYMKDVADNIRENKRLGGISAITVGDVTINRPANGWDSSMNYEGEHPADENGEGGYQVKLIRHDDMYGELYFSVNVSLTGESKGMNTKLPVIVYDNAGNASSTGTVSDEDRAYVKIDIGAPKAVKINAEELIRNIIKNNKLKISAEFNDKYGSSAYSGIRKVVYRFVENTDPRFFGNVYVAEYNGTENDIRTQTADFDFTGQNLKGYIVVELTDLAGNTAVYYYSGKEADGYVTDDPDNAEKLIIDNSVPPLPVIYDENLVPDASIDGRSWFKDYHRVRFGARDEDGINSGIASVGIIVCGKENELDVTGLGFGTEDADIEKAQKSLENGEFYIDFVPEETDVTKFTPHLKNLKNSSIDIVLTKSPVSLSDEGRLDVSIYSVDNAGNRSRHESADTVSTEYYIDNNAPDVTAAFDRSSTETEDSVRINSFGTYAKRRISVEVPVTDEKKGASSGIAEAKLSYICTDGNTHTVDADRIENGKAVFTIPEEELAENTYKSGYLTISVKDNVGNITKNVPLKGTNGKDKLIIENILPEISDKPELSGGESYTRNSGTDNEEVWFGGDAELSFSITDKQSGIRRVTVNNTEGRFISDKPFEKEYTEGEEQTESDTYTLKTDPELDGAFSVSVTAEDNSGNTDSREYKVFKDVQPPSVTGFRFDQAVSNYDNELVDPEKKDRYSHFANDIIPMTVHIDDNSGSSSGIKEVHILLTPVNGEAEEKVIEAKDMAGYDGSGSCDAVYYIPEGFKGDITAWAVDNVGNTSEKRSPNGFISENEQRHETHVGFKIDLPQTDKKDEDGLELFKEDVKAKIEVSDDYSGIQQISWITSDMDDWETVDIDMEGRIVGDAKGWSVSENVKDRNIAVKISRELTVSKDANNDFIMLRVKDNTGHITTTEKRFSIDKKAPAIDVSGIDRTDGVTYYNSPKSVNITITERNYDAPQINGSADTSFTEEGNAGKGSDDRKYRKTLSFSGDGRYEVNIDASDLAGNSAEQYRSGVFVIDTTAPRASINVRKYDGSAVTIGEKTYIETDASASVTVDEENFDPNSINISINGNPYVPSNWSAGSSHTANIPSSYFSADGSYTITVSGKDLAGNSLRSVSSSFTVDKKEPEVKISGISGANKGEVAPVVNITDDNLDAQDVRVYKNGSLLNVTYENDGEVAKYDVNDKGKYIVGRWASDNLEMGIKKKLVFDNFPEEESYDGNYKIEVDTKDKADNSSSDSMEFSVNRFGSVFTVQNEKNINGKYLNNPPTIVITEKNVDRHKSGSDVIIIIDKGSNTVKLTEDLYTVSEPVELEDGSGYEYTYTIKSQNFDQDLNYNISIQSVDEAGNKNVSSGRGAEISFTVDTHKPDFKCDDLADRAEFNEASRVFKLNVNEKLTHIKVTTSQNEVLLDLDEENEDNSYTFSMPSSNSSRDLTIELTDLAGNRTVKTYKDLLITENVALFVMHKTWAKVAGVVAAAGIGAIVGAYIIRKRWRGY